MIDTHINGREEISLPYRKITNNTSPSKKWSLIFPSPNLGDRLDRVTCFQIIEQERKK